MSERMTASSKKSHRGFFGVWIIRERECFLVRGRHGEVIGALQDSMGTGRNEADTK